MFGKITEIIDNYVYVENSTHELKNNILNIHVVFPEANHRVVGEVLSVNVDVIKIFLVGEIRNGVFFPGVMRKPSFQTIPMNIPASFVMWNPSFTLSATKSLNSR